MYNYYLTRHMEFTLFTRVNKLTHRIPNGNQSITVVAVDLMSVDTMTYEDKVDMVTREDVGFLFLLMGFADIEVASSFMDDFIDKVKSYPRRVVDRHVK